MGLLERGGSLERGALFLTNDKNYANGKDMTNLLRVRGVLLFMIQ